MPRRWVDVVRQVGQNGDKVSTFACGQRLARQLADQTIFSDLKQALKDLSFEYRPIDVELTESCLTEMKSCPVSDPAI